MKAFLSGVVLAIILSYYFPEVGVKGGPVHSEIFIKKIGVGIIFFCSGMKLNTEQIRKAGLNWRAHVFCQCYTFCFTPVLVYLAMTALQPLLAEPLAQSGFVFDAVKTLACLPPPVSSAVILTAIARGDEAVAIFNSSVGSFLGIFITPVLVTLLVTGPPDAATAAAAAAVVVDPASDGGVAGRAMDVDGDGSGGEGGGDISAGEMALELSLSVLLPLIVGQLVKRALRLGKPPSWIGSLILVLIIWASFCELWVSDITVTLGGLGFMVASVVTIQSCGLLLVWVLTSKVLKFEAGVRSALLFACTHKSLTLGMPLIDVLFPGMASAMAIPILMCHPLQILGGGFIAGNLAASESNAPRSPRSVAYKAVHDATQMELGSYQESGDDESFDARDDQYSASSPTSPGAGSDGSRRKSSRPDFLNV